MPCILDMTLTSLVADVAPRTGEIIKNCQNVLKEEKIHYKVVYHTMCLINYQKSRWKVRL